MIFLFTHLLKEGGPTFMYATLLSLICCISLIVIAFVKGDPERKFQNLLHHISLFTLVWGFLGQMIGLIGAFDTLEATGATNPEVFAGGLKIALLSPAFGMLVFLIARVGIIGLTFQRKKNIA